MWQRLFNRFSQPAWKHMLALCWVMDVQFCIPVEAFKTFFGRWLETLRLCSLWKLGMCWRPYYIYMNTRYQCIIAKQLDIAWCVCDMSQLEHQCQQVGVLPKKRPSHRQTSFKDRSVRSWDTWRSILLLLHMSLLIAWAPANWAPFNDCWRGCPFWMRWGKDLKQMYHKKSLIEWSLLLLQTLWCLEVSGSGNFVWDVLATNCVTTT